MRKPHEQARIEAIVERVIAYEIRMIENEVAIERRRDEHRAWMDRHYRRLDRIQTVVMWGGLVLIAVSVLIKAITRGWGGI